MTLPPPSFSARLPRSPAYVRFRRRLLTAVFSLVVLGIGVIASQMHASYFEREQGVGLGLLLIFLLAACHFALRSYSKLEERELRYRQLYATSQETEEKLHLNEQRLRLVTDNLPVQIAYICTDRDVARIAQQILKKMAEPFVLNQEVAQISSSIGITLYPDDGVDADTLLKNADQAMYAAKQQGRNRFRAIHAGSDPRAHGTEQRAARRGPPQRIAHLVPAHSRFIRRKNQQSRSTRALATSGTRIADSIGVHHHRRKRRHDRQHRRPGVPAGGAASQAHAATGIRGFPDL